MSGVIDGLKAGREAAEAWLRPAFNHAIALAREAEFQAARASNEVQAYISPAYPPLVEMLADATGGSE